MTYFVFSLMNRQNTPTSSCTCTDDKLRLKLTQGEEDWSR